MLSFSARRPAPSRHALLVLPALILIVGVFIYPVGRLLLRSVSEPVWGLQNFRELLAQPVYFNALVNTVVISGSVTLLCLLAGYPLAFTIARARGRVQRLLIFAVLIPFWSSILVRTFAWLVLLQSRGLVNRTLIDLGIIDTPIVMVHNRIGVLVGMVHILLPFMVLPLYSVMVRIDASYTNAAASLGARPVRNFLRVYLPLSWPGIINGTVLVFVMGLGYFITPALLGGAGDTMIAQLIEVEVADLGRWGVAGALALVLMFGVTVTFALLFRIGNRARRT
ncbi:MAG TPA: ABC transporter permease [Bradyrhizobium sp.]|nr:ABC transporter permease [Bradyrhizobium sp.]